MSHAATHALEHPTSTGLDNRKLAIWTFIGSECLFFASLISTYLVYRGKSLKAALNIFKKHFITKALEANGWHQTRTAKALDIQRSYLSKLVKELGIMKERGV